MPLVTEEQKEKRTSMFLRMESGSNRLTLQSNVYVVPSHYLKADKKTVACFSEDCKVDHTINFPRKEYYYLGSLNDEIGVVQVPASAFFSMNEIEKAMGKDKRKYSWLIIKSGSMLETKYTASKDEPLTAEELKYDIEKNNHKLGATMSRYEVLIGDKYNEFIGESGGAKKNSEGLTDKEIDEISEAIDAEDAE